MKRFLLLATILITSQLSAQNLQFQWVKSWPFAIDMRTCDSEDNIYLAGKVFDTLQYGGYTLINHDIGQFDIYIAKLDSSFNLIWLKQIAGSTAENVTGLNVDSQDNLVVSVIFKSSAVVESDSIFASTFFHRPLLVKYAPDGSLIYYTTPVYSNTSCLHLFNTVIDKQDNIIIHGEKSGELIFSDSSTLAADTNLYFLEKLDADGNKLWAQSTPYEFSKLTTGPSGNIVALASEGIFKYLSSGAFYYQKVFPYGVFDIAIDSLENIYLTGQFDSAFVLEGVPYAPSGHYNGILQKTNPDGDNIWVNLLIAENVFPYGVAVNDNRLTLAGRFSRTLHIGNDSLVGMLQGNYMFSLFVAGFDLSGSLLFNNLITSNNSMQGGYIFANDAIYLNGITDDTTWFDQYMYVPANASYTEEYIAKIHGITQGIEQVSATDIAVYPNPCSDFVEISLPNTSQHTFAEIVNTEGRILKKVQIENVREIIDIRFLNSGIYFIRIADPEFSSVHRIFKI
ncbi:MAG TPA: T9SS type A sorting domain-containing protein [Bacteroidales bacterium]|nr:T9SS type A sorting domain-containing protein [Bacteroidales bacterium]